MIFKIPARPHKIEKRFRGIQRLIHQLKFRWQWDELGDGARLSFDEQISPDAIIVLTGGTLKYEDFAEFMTLEELKIAIECSLGNVGDHHRENINSLADLLDSFTWINAPSHINWGRMHDRAMAKRV